LQLVEVLSGRGPSLDLLRQCFRGGFIQRRLLFGPARRFGNVNAAKRDLFVRGLVVVVILLDLCVGRFREFLLQVLVVSACKGLHAHQLQAFLELRGLIQAGLLCLVGESQQFDIALGQLPPRGRGKVGPDRGDQALELAPGHDRAAFPIRFGMSTELLDRDHRLGIVAGG
jgi:hypothetical protein